jgi:hypothetical protein
MATHIESLDKAEYNLGNALRQQGKLEVAP